MTDRELLELAAKAAGIEILDWYGDKYACLDVAANLQLGWNPLTDDGDALRLAVKLSIDIIIHPEEVCCFSSDENSPRFAEISVKDPYAATRRAIVRAAAEVGKAMKKK